MKCDSSQLLKCFLLISGEKWKDLQGRIEDFDIWVGGGEGAGTGGRRPTKSSANTEVRLDAIAGWGRCLGASPRKF